MQDRTGDPDFSQDCSPNCCKVAAMSQQYLSDLSEKDKPWDQHRAEAQIVEHLYHTGGLPDYGSRIHDCSRWLSYALEAQDESDFKFRLTSARFCRVRFCPVCQWRRSLKWRARFFNALPKIVENFPGYRYLFLTLTVRNCPIDQLRSQLRDMSKAWNRLASRRIFPAVGFVRSTEVTRGENGSAHPHFHCLFLVKPSYFSREYIKQNEWVKLWKDALQVDYLPSVHIRAVKDGERTEHLILECLKYGVKVQDLVSDPNWLVQLTGQLTKTRAVSVGGVLKDFIKEEEPDNLLNIDEEEEDIEQSMGELWFNWHRDIKRYVKC